MSRLEKTGEKQIRTWCLQVGILFIKFTPFGEVGWPDRIAILPGGVHVWLELKRKGKKPTPIQYHRIECLAQQGATVNWFDSPEECITYLRGLLHA